MQSRATVQLSFAAVLLALACGRAAPSVDSARPTAVNAAAQTPVALRDAKATVERRYAQHFAGGQGFSLDTLRARRAWFTPRLYELMLADMGHREEGISFIEADPFVDSQDGAKAFALRDARQAHDTVLVDVDVTYPPDAGNGHETRRVAVALLPSAGAWQIADLRYSHGSLAAGLLASAVP